MTQNEALKRFLNTHGSITRIEAYNELGITNLWERCREIEKQGYALRREDGVEVRDRRGNSCRVTRYHKAAGRASPSMALADSESDSAAKPVPAAPTVGARLTLFGRKVEVTHVGISAYDGSAWMATREVV